ncbi:hypothetical protein [Rudanella lutea]|uniref:hypothetical protein n=1 Tax=Rudanella lutea TaxID=451374 RepID=UPI0003690965|nr:hypothetical protein [Rudanella lutea]
MKILVFILGLLLLMIGCKREEIAPEPKPTEINVVVMNEARRHFNAEAQLKSLKYLLFT